jgi:hypothetical protein
MGLNPQMADTDGDGVSDGDELKRGMDPLAVNYDADGVPAFVEVNWDGSPAYNPYHRTLNPAGTDLSVESADTDGDGVSDLEEIAAGSSPRNQAASNRVTIASTLIIGGTNVVRWNVYSNPVSADVTFYVEYSTNVSSPWIAGGWKVSNGDTNKLEEFRFKPLGGVMFYRLRFSME